MVNSYPLKFIRGKLQIEIHGTTTSQIGRMTISSAATLDGMLNLALVKGFSPAIGNSFQVLTFGSRAGQFATINGLAIGNGNQFTPAYNATNLTLNVATAAALPMPAYVTTPSSSSGNSNLSGSSGSPVSIGTGNIPQVSSVTKITEGMTFQFSTVIGRTYRLEGTEDMASGRWTVLVDNIQGTGTFLQMIDPSYIFHPHYFYRIVVLPCRLPLPEQPGSNGVKLRRNGRTTRQRNNYDFSRHEDIHTSEFGRANDQPTAEKARVVAG